MINLFSSVLLKIYAITHSNKAKDTITAEDLASVEQYRKECLDKLKEDLLSIRNRINNWITVITTSFIAIVLGLASVDGNIQYEIKAVVISIVVLMYLLLVFDILLSRWNEDLIDKRRKNKLSNQEVMNQRSVWHYWSHIFDFSKVAVLGIIAFAVIVIVLSA